MKPTRVCQLGNGRKQITPVPKESSRPAHGTPFSVLLSKTDGAYPLRLRPKEMREVEVV